MIRIYWVPNLKSGTLGMMARPRGQDWLQDEIAYLKLHNVDVVVSLLERHETYELGLQKEAQYCHDSKVEFINFPIKEHF